MPQFVSISTLCSKYSYLQTQSSFKKIYMNPITMLLETGGAGGIITLNRLLILFVPGHNIMIMNLIGSQNITETAA